MTCIATLWDISDSNSTVYQKQQLQLFDDKGQSSESKSNSVVSELDSQQYADAQMQLLLDEKIYLEQHKFRLQQDKETRRIQQKEAQPKRMKLVNVDGEVKLMPDDDLRDDESYSSDSDSESESVPDSEAERLNPKTAVARKIPYEFSGLSVSVVIPAKYERPWIVTTLHFLYMVTPFQLLLETIIIDDNSDDGMESIIQNGFKHQLAYLTQEQRESIKVLRMNKRQGLVRSKTIGGNLAKGTHIFFMDGHCRPAENWLEPLLARSLPNYKRIVTPGIPDVDARDWSRKSNAGMKMLFKWNFWFDWYDDNGDESPIACGGILLISKRWWTEIGGYDDGMEDWGGENIEQALRTWMCGGEIVAERTSLVGHVFNRPKVDDKVKHNAMPRNKGRGAYMWLDDYYQYFLDTQPGIETWDLGDNLLERLLFRYRYGCKKFEWFLHRFQGGFEFQGLILDKQHHIRHTKSRLCLEAQPHHQSIILNDCNLANGRQRWGFISHRQQLISGQLAACAAQVGSSWQNGKTVLKTQDCDRLLLNHAQHWTFSNQLEPSVQKDRHFHDSRFFAGRIFSHGPMAENNIVGLPSEDYHAAKKGFCFSYSEKDFKTDTGQAVTTGSTTSIKGSGSIGQTKTINKGQNSKHTVRVIECMSSGKYDEDLEFDMIY